MNARTIATTAASLLTAGLLAAPAAAAPASGLGPDDISTLDSAATVICWTTQQNGQSTLKCTAEDADGIDYVAWYDTKDGPISGDVHPRCRAKSITFTATGLVNNQDDRFSVMDCKGVQQVVTMVHPS